MLNIINKIYYNIQIKYITGDSFNSFEEVENLEIVTSSIDIAKYNLDLIKKRHHLYENNPTGFTEDNYQLEFKTDSGEIRKMSPFWEGYFEQLISAKIVIDEDENKDLEFILHNI